MSVPQKPSSVSRIVFSLGFIIVSAVYALWQNLNKGQTTVSLPTLQSMMNAPMMHGQYIDGSYTGKSFDAYYGILQVKAVIRGGNIIDVQFLQYANNTENSRFINNQAMPLLTQEAIQVQSANVDGVSGATFTSEAFRQSLAGVLVLAKN